MKTNETLNYSEKITKSKKGLKGFLSNFKKKFLCFFKESEIDMIIKENMKKYPNITKDQAAGRKEVTINGKTGFLNGDGKLGTINGDNKFVTYEKIENIVKKNKKRYPNITKDQAAGKKEVTINGKTGLLNGDGKLGIINGDGKFITYEQLGRATKRNLEKFPGITEDQAAGEEKITMDGKTGYLNGDGKLGTINGDNEFVTYEKIENVAKKNMKRYPNITKDQAAGKKEVTINGKTGLLNGDGKLGIINGDGKFITYEQLGRATKRNLEKFPGITEDQAAGREKVTINGETGYLNGDGILCKAA